MRSRDDPARPLPSPPEQARSLAVTGRRSGTSPIKAASFADALDHSAAPSWAVQPSGQESGPRYFHCTWLCFISGSTPIIVLTLTPRLLPALAFVTRCCAVAEFANAFIRGLIPGHIRPTVPDKPLAWRG